MSRWLRSMAAAGVLGYRVAWFERDWHGDRGYLPPERFPAQALATLDGWLRHRFEELGVIQFEDWVDTGSEYENFALTDEELAPAS